MSDLRFGADAKLKRNSGTYGVPVWNEIKNVNDTLNVGLSRGEQDATIRAGGRVMQEPTLVVNELTFKMLEDLDDTEFLALRAAFFAKTALDLHCCSGDLTVAGETYVRCDYKVFGFNKAEPINGINTYDVVLKPCHSTNPFLAGITT